MTTSTEIDDDRLHYVLSEEELTDCERALIEVRGREIGVFFVDGEFYAIGNHCPHMGGPCAEGMVTGMFDVDEDGEVAFVRDGEIVCCPWHGWQFDLITGDHLGKSKKRVLTYEVIVRDGDVYVVV